MGKDRQPPLPSLRLADFLRDEHERILEEWARAEREHVDSARKTRNWQELVDHIPAMLIAIRRVAEQADGGDQEVEVPHEDAAKHAQHRLEHRFSLKEVTREYALLRKTILGLLAPRVGELDFGELVLLNASLDQAIVETVTAFVAGANRFEARQAQRSRVMADAGVALSQERSRQALLQRCLQALVDHGDAMRACVWLLEDGDTPVLQASAGRPMPQEEAPGGEAPVEREVKRIARERRSSLTPIGAGDVRPDAPEGMAFAGSPMMVGERLVGVVGLFARAPLPEDTLESLAMLCNGMAQAVERLRTEDALRESEERLRMATQAARMGTWRVDLRTGATTRDAALNGVLGLEPRSSQHSVEDWLARVHPEDRAWVEAEISRFMDAAQDLDVELRVVRPDGGIRWVRDRGTVLRDREGRPSFLLGAAADITEEKHAQEEVARMATIVEESAEFVGMLRSSGDIFFANRAGRRLVGLGPVEALSLRDLFPPESVPEAEALLRLALETGQGVGEVRARHLRTGELIPLSWHVFTLRGHDSGPSRILAVVARDLRAQKAHDAEVQRRADFEEKLIGIVSHDLRNPLSAILLGASSLLRRDGLDERIIKATLRIQSSAERATRMIRDLLDFTQARLGGGISLTRKALDLHLLARQTVDELEAIHPERTVRLETAGEGRAELDGDRVSQVLSNLLSNALRYSPADSPVTVRTRGEDDTVVLEVHNPGAPIPAELLPRLFLPMQRATPGMDQSTRSVGLGLYIVDHLVRAHGGSVAVRSTADEGTTFTVRLPRHPSAPGQGG